VKLDAILKVKADVQGQGEIDGLSRSLGNLNKQAGAVGGGLGRMGQAAKGVGGLMGALLPVGAIAGLGVLASKSINAADNLYDLSLRTGVSVEALSKFSGAAEDSGTSVDAVAKGLGRLNRGLAEAGNSASTYASKVKQSSESAEEAVKRNEQRQIETIREAARRKMEVLEDETDSRMRELNRRYRNEQTLLDDRYDDQADREQEAADNELRQLERNAQARNDQIRKSIQNDESLSDSARDQRLAALSIEEEDALRNLRDGFEDRQKLRYRQLRDARRIEEDALNERKRVEEEGIRAVFETQKRETEKGLESQVHIVEQSAREQIAALDVSTKGVAAALAEMGISTVDAAGKTKPAKVIFDQIADSFAAMEDPARKAALAQSLFGKGGQELIPMLEMGSEAINAYEATVSTKMAKAADKFQESISSIERALKGPFGEAITELLPHITDFAEALNGLITWFTALPGPVQVTIGAIGGLLALFIALAPAISAIVTIGGALGALFATGGALASAGSVIAGILTVIQLTFAGVLTFLSGTVMPALIAFFSGPVGWTVLAVAAVVAMGIAFREPLTKFLRWLWEWGKPIRQFWLNLWNGAAGFAKGAFETAAGVVKNIFRGMLQYVVDRINVAAGLINVLIRAFNRLPAPNIPLIPELTVPAFAQGGVVDRPTLAMVGEGGEREYVVPESKMAAASSNFLAGARGGAVLAGAASGGGTPTINITTGPVMEFDGQRYVTVADMERAMRLTAEGVIGRLRTPSARIALGIA
jgi:hypothetical protein